MHGYHIYKDAWIAAVGEELPCIREPTNRKDRFAVAITKDSDIVDHVPRKIFSIYSMFLHQSGTISCYVTGCRQYSKDLIQGELEILCTLTLPARDGSCIEKTKKLIEQAQVNLNQISFLRR